MLPRSTNTRVRRERQHPSGRSQEIQRLIGRSLRCAVNLDILGEKTVKIRNSNETIKTTNAKRMKRTNERTNKRKENL